jgi:hypothetical protein
MAGEAAAGRSASAIAEGVNIARAPAASHSTAGLPGLTGARGYPSQLLGERDSLESKQQMMMQALQGLAAEKAKLQELLGQEQALQQQLHAKEAELNGAKR